MKVLTCIRDELRLRPWKAIEILLALVFLIGLVENPGVWTFARIWLTAFSFSAEALIPLLAADSAATFVELARVLLRILLAFAPAVLAIYRAPWHRRLWLVPVVLILVVVSSPVSLAAGATALRWLLLVSASAIALLAQRFRWFGWVLLVPVLLLFECAPSHVLAPWRTAKRADREQLLARCQQHDGERAENLTSDQLMPYHGVNALTDDLALLSGEGAEDGDMRGWAGDRRVGSWWLRRVNGRFRFELPSSASGNLWRGCILDGTIWIARANFAVGVKRLPEGGSVPEEVYRIGIPSRDIDFGETACDPQHHRVYISEATEGGLWSFDPLHQDFRRVQIGGIVLLPKFRRDGQLVLTNTGTLMTFDPGGQRITQSLAAGLMISGFDICDKDGSVAVADVAGRLRVFRLSAGGRYEFAWGVSMFAPRRVAWGRDCTRLALTSGDDRRVFMVDTDKHSINQTFTAGPALREVAATGPRELSVTDVCGVTSYRW
ncbi:MAG: hypothetical protein HY270_15310 [Deltaproteobacteria bacterium]|nr:hypothetical protein [Deltaproteobacteria bacterium]